MDTATATGAHDALPDPRNTPVLSVPAAGRLVGLSRDAAYRAARTGQLPTVRYGRTVKVPTAALLRQLGLSA
jgi:hypothetical protein